MLRLATARLLSLLTPLRVGGALAVGVAAFMFLRFKVAPPTGYLVRTGLGIANVSITKTCVQWPLQRVT
jgi:hypothetical protein